MKISELIESPSQFPPETEVFVDDFAGSGGLEAPILVQMGGLGGLLISSPGAESISQARKVQKS